MASGNPPWNEARPVPTSSVSAQDVTQHRPSVPSGLRQAHMPPSSPEARYHRRQQEYGAESARHTAGIERGHIHPFAHDFAQATSAVSGTAAAGDIDEPSRSTTARTRLLGNERQYHIPNECGEYDCNHGTFSPRPGHQRGYGSFASNYDGPATPGEEGARDGHLPDELGDGLRSAYRRNHTEDALGNAVTDGLLSKAHTRTTTARLVQKYGVRNEQWLYLLYYIPFTNWIRQYRWKFLHRDFIAALTMASFYIPMALSLASNLAHVPPVNGLYSFAVNPLIYALLGTCPLMVVGPEAAGSLLTGSVVKEAIKAGTHLDSDGTKHAQVAGMVTGLAGAIILAAGLCRLGFLDGVLSRPFLRGFISAIGIVILVDQLIPEMGLNSVAKESQAAQHGSSLDKIMFLFRHGHEAHRLTCAVSFSTIAIVLVCREVKRRLQPRMGWVAYIPDRFAVVVLSAVLAWRFDWESQGVGIMGDIRSESTPFRVHFPFDESNFKHVNDAFSTAFIIALLGFFESSVAAKSLGNSSGKVRKVTDKYGEEVEECDGIQNMNLSPNRELVALGVANLVGGLFMALPGFGGYGRSKVNASTGGKTPMSSIFLALITVICILFLLPYFYYIPKGVLSAMISVVAYSLIEEAPHDIHFFVTISGWVELTLMSLIFFATFLWNLKIGIAVGIGLSLLRLLKHSTRPRIQILGRVPGTHDFENAELYGRIDEQDRGDGQGVEMVPHSLIIKIPEPLTFANTGSLKDRLRRLEDHGTSGVHPAVPKVRRPEHNQNIIFDIHGVTKLDPAAAQVLLEIVESYCERGTRVFFCRVPSRKTEVWRLMVVTGIVELCGGENHFLRSVDEALRATEREEGLMEAIENDVMGAHASDTNSPPSRRHTWAAALQGDDGWVGQDRA